VARLSRVPVFVLKSCVFEWPMPDLRPSPGQLGHTPIRDFSPPTTPATKFDAPGVGRTSGFGQVAYVSIEHLEDRMSARSVFAQLVVSVSLAFIAPNLWAQNPVPGALSPANLASPLGQTFAVGDFDNDSQPDGAVLVELGRFRGHGSLRIELHLSNSENAPLVFESTAAAHALAATDIDHDGDLDLVVAQPFAQQLLYVWLNDGHGVFEQGRIEDFPSAVVNVYEDLTQPVQHIQLPYLLLPPRRGAEIAMLAERRLPETPSSTSQSHAQWIAARPPSVVFTLNSPRAPPVSPSQ
jgi:FG-GAP repeat